MRARLEWEADYSPFTVDRDVWCYFIISPSALLDDPTFFPEDQHWACQAEQTKQNMKLIRPDETIPLIRQVTVACLISSAHKLCLKVATIFGVEKGSKLVIKVSSNNESILVWIWPIHSYKMLEGDWQQKYIHPVPPVAIYMQFPASVQPSGIFSASQVCQ